VGRLLNRRQAGSCGHTRSGRACVLFTPTVHETSVQNRYAARYSSTSSVCARGADSHAGLNYVPVDNTPRRPGKYCSSAF